MNFGPVVSTLCVAIISIGVILCPYSANACSWPEGYRLTEAAVIDRFCEADAVFVGKVESLSVTIDKVTESKIWPKRVYKGQPGAPVYALQARDIRTPNQRLCDFRLQPTAQYLIFADRYEELEYICVSACDLSQPYHPDSFAYRVVESIENVQYECGEEASRKRQAEFRQGWVTRLSQRATKEELEEAARQLRKADESDADEP
jgi:hypothetical protein